MADLEPNITSDVKGPIWDSLEEYERHRNPNDDLRPDRYEYLYDLAGSDEAEKY